MNKGSRPTISAVMAVYNEEGFLEDCLKSVSWCDEIVVVDGSSTDKTVAIVKKYTGKIISTTNKPMFHVNKQMAIDAAKSDWILQMDADERVSQELHGEILQVVASDPKENGFWIPRSNYFLGRFLRKGGQYPDYTIRLYRNGKGRLPCKTVHEQAEVDGKVGYLKSDLLHFADPQFRRYLQRSNRYSTETAEAIAKLHPQDSPLVFVKYFLWMPIWTFLKIYIRHKGFVDGFPGFVFALYSGLHFRSAYVKYWESRNTAKNL